jgi:hypothetical protein
MIVVGRTSGAPAATGSAAITYPTHQAGDRTFVYLGGKYNGTTIPSVPAGSGMVRVTSVGGGTGTAGADTGTTFGVVFVKEHAASGEASPTFTAGATAPNTWAWVAITLRLEAGESWEDTTAQLTNAEQWFQDANTASPFGVAANASLSLQPSAEDAILAFGTIPTDSGSGIASATMSAPGLSGGTVDTTGGYSENALGDDCAVVMGIWEGFTGTATGAITPNFTVTGATNHSGIGFVMAVRIVPAPPIEPPWEVRIGGVWVPADRDLRQSGAWV